MSDADLETEITRIKPSRNFSRLSVQILEVALDRITRVITNQLESHQEHVPEPEPNPQGFTGYIKYDKEAYIKHYEEMKPLRDLARMIRTFLPNMRTISDGLQRRYRELVEQRELRQIQRQLRDHMNLPRLDNDADEGNDELPLLENVEPLD